MSDRARLLAGLMVSVAAFTAAGPAGCASPPSPWLVDQAEAQLAAGRPALALQYSERAIHTGWDRPSEQVFELHLAALRALGRDAEADAFRGFVQRYAAGEDTADRDTAIPWRDCWIPRSEHERLRSFTWRRLYPIGSLAASFQIEEDGRLAGIRILRADHPAAAWLMIAAVSEARVYETRLAELREDPQVRFPLTTCVWLNSDSW